MGPTILFDKSFLQSLSLDESVWFDHFFVPNICPLFFAETLADLEKAPRAGKSAEEEVSIIADKTPQMHGAICAHHSMMIGNSLRQRPVAMDTGQIPVAGGRRVRLDKQIGTMFEPSPEARAFGRWQRREFHDLEREFARGWRAQLVTESPHVVRSAFEGLGFSDVLSVRSLKDARAAAAYFVSTSDHAAARAHFALSLLGSHPSDLGAAQVAVESLGALKRCAPYAAFAAEVEVFFYLSLIKGQISGERASNHLDIAYLYYLPFCMTFVSSDNLHKRVAPFFLREDQQFVWGGDLKNALRLTNEHYKLLPEEIKELGIMAFAHSPPDLEGSILVQIWDKHFPDWRALMTGDRIEAPRSEPGLVERLSRFERAPTISPDDPDAAKTESDSLSIKRLVSRQRGTWFQLPKDLQEPT